MKQRLLNMFTANYQLFTEGNITKEAKDSDSLLKERQSAGKAGLF
jgi:hypothetical protein